MPPPQVGRGKLAMFSGEEVLPQKKSKAAKKLAQVDTWTFAVSDGQPRPLPEAGPNVLYVETPRIGLMQTPEWKVLTRTWAEAMDLLRPVMRFGMPHTSLMTKCPHYSESLSTKPEGRTLLNSRLRNVVDGVADGTLWHRPGRELPHSRPPIHDLPVVLVLASNLLCYWAITKTANRGG